MEDITDGEDDGSYIAEASRESVCTIGSLLIQLQSLRTLLEIEPNPRDGLHFLLRISFWELTDSLKTDEFRISFQMNRADFRTLVDIMRPYLERDEK